MRGGADAEAARMRAADARRRRERALSDDARWPGEQVPFSVAGALTGVNTHQHDTATLSHACFSSAPFGFFTRASYPYPYPYPYP